ncbi:MAG: hypothetical protein NUK65_09425 [Firmicutes bacterium]|nr:hypothetical protein [Bacillota bacterium]
MNDRFTNGLLGGTLAGIVYITWSLISQFILHWTNRTVVGFGSLLSFNQPPQSAIQYAWGAIVALGISAGVGIVFSYLVLLIESENLYLKAIVYSMGVWFLLNDVVVPRISETADGPFTIGTVSSASIGAILFGIVLAYTYGFLVKRVVE